MPDPVIACPSCGTEIKLNETLAGPLLDEMKAGFETRLAELRAASAQREAALEAERQAVAAARAAIGEELARRLAAERGRIKDEEAKRAKAQAADDVAALRETMAEMTRAAAEREAKLAVAQKAQAEVERQRRSLEDQKREIELTVETRVSAGLTAEREKARAEAEAAQGLRLAEKEETIAAMGRQIEDLKRRAEQGSQQLQGEVLELRLEELLGARFPMDGFEPVAKGESGADLMHRVYGPGAVPCGAILWETKRTKVWNDGWLAKLKGDLRAARAEVAVLLSETLPKGHQTLDLVDGVWVAHPRHAVPVALVLRQSLVDLAAARMAQDGQETKMQLVYAYLTGPQFRHRVEAIVERFADMSDDLARERRAMTRGWAKREKQIEQVISSTVGMYGDLQGIAGRAMADLPVLDLPLLDTGEAGDEG
jgi:hypothetical protein